MIYFEDEPLDGVVNEIARYTTLRLVVADDTVRSLRLGGTFQANAAGAQSFLAMLEDGLRLRVTRDKDYVYIETAASQRGQALAGSHRSTSPSQGPTE
jgi:ferric-dicitrate binding protein FerR (iron transport regulator)